MRRICVLIVGLAVSGIAPPVEAVETIRLPQLVPAWATPAARLGPVADERSIEVQLVLPWQDGAAVRRLVAGVSDPESAAYGRYLTPEQFRARFAPSRQTVDAAVWWLRSRGLEVGRLPANRAVISARGSARTVGRAFGVTLAHHRVGKLALYAPDRAPALPEHLARLGILVRGLDQSAALLTAGGAPEPATFSNPAAVTAPGADVSAEPPPPIPDTPANPADAASPNAVLYATPCSSYDGAHIEHRVPAYAGIRPAAVTCATSVASLRAAYGVDVMLRRGIDGRGQTIVMVGSHEIRRLPGDIGWWSARYGLPRLRRGQFNQLSYPGAYETPADPLQTVLRPQVWAVQAAMLFETMRAVAPGADYLYVGSTSSLDLPNAMFLLWIGITATSSSTAGTRPTKAG